MKPSSTSPRYTPVCPKDGPNGSTADPLSDGTTNHPADGAFSTARSLYQAGKLGAAARQCQSILAGHPNFWRASHLIGLVAMAQGRPKQALPFLQRAARSGAAPALAALATALHRLGHLHAAETALRAAIAVEPECAEFLCNLGNLLQRRQNLDAAIVAYDRAIHLTPDLVAAHFNRGLAHLRNGAFREGWPGYEWRWRRPGAPQHFHTAAPGWAGQACPNRTLLLHTEQGLGDMLQFCRFLPTVVVKAGTDCRIVIECPTPLLRLLRANVPGITWVAKAIKGRTEVPPFDVQASIPSLPGLLGITLDTLQSEGPYLRLPADAPVPPAALTGKDEHGRGDTFTVGLVWGGSPNFPARDVPAPMLAAALDAPGLRLVSLQVGPHAKALEAAQSAVHGTVYDGGRWIVEQGGDFTATAALMTQLDLIVSVDTATAHLAGALGRPLALPLPDLPDWRWMLGRTDSPWYPTARLFRQERPGDWTTPLARLRAHVLGLAKCWASQSDLQKPLHKAPHDQSAQDRS